jgi:hypothetical protein
VAHLACASASLASSLAVHSNGRKSGSMDADQRSRHCFPERPLIC